MRYVSCLILLSLCSCNPTTQINAPTQNSQSSQSTTSSTTSSSNKPAAAVEPSSFSRFMYVANQGDDTLTQFGIDPSNGYLWDIGVNNRITTHSQPYILLIDASKKFLFCINKNSTYIDVYSINSSTGLLTFVYSQDMGDEYQGYQWNGTNQIYFKVGFNFGKIWNYNTSTGTLSYQGDYYNSMNYQVYPINPIVGSNFTYNIQGTNNIELISGGTDTKIGFSTGNSPSQFIIY